MMIVILYGRVPPRNAPRPPLPLTSRRNVLGSGANRQNKSGKTKWKCSIPIAAVDRDSRGVVRLSICNAGSLNILSSAVTDGVREGFEKLAGDKGIRAVILAGQSEKSMIGGADIKEMAKLDQKSAEAFITRLRDLCEAVRNFPAPVIARLPGWCLGGGLEVAAACDFRIAAHDAKFGMPEVRVGIPSVIHAALLPRLIGWGRARWLVMTAENIDAPTALGLGPGRRGREGRRARCRGRAYGEGAAGMRPRSAARAEGAAAPMGGTAADGVGQFERRRIRKSFLTGEPQRLMQGFLDRKK